MKEKYGTWNEHDLTLGVSLSPSLTRSRLDEGQRGDLTHSIYDDGAHARSYRADLSGERSRGGYTERDRLGTSAYRESYASDAGRSGYVDDRRRSYGNHDDLHGSASLRRYATSMTTADTSLFAAQTFHLVFIR